jgi:hypothetical protein
MNDPNDTLRHCVNFIFHVFVVREIKTYSYIVTVGNLVILISCTFLLTVKLQIYVRYTDIIKNKPEQQRATGK